MTYKRGRWVALEDGAQRVNRTPLGVVILTVVQSGARWRWRWTVKLEQARGPSHVSAGSERSERKARAQANEAARAVEQAVRDYRARRAPGR